MKPTSNDAREPGSLHRMVRALQLKAAIKQATIESCPGHTWGNVYWSQIDYMRGSSAVCRNCGERRSLDDIAKDPNADWVGAMPPLRPNDKS